MSFETWHRESYGDWMYFVDFPLFLQGRQFCEILFAYLQNKASEKGPGVKFLPLRVDPFQKRARSNLIRLSAIKM